MSAKKTRRDEVYLLVVSNRWKSMIGKPINQLISIDKMSSLVSIGISRYWSIDDQLLITTQKQFIDWHNPNPVFSMQRIYPIARVLELPTCSGISNQWKSMIRKPIDNHTNLRNRLVIHYQCQSID